MDLASSFDNLHVFIPFILLEIHVLNEFRRFITKVKIKLSLCLTKNDVMETYWGNGGIVPRIHYHGIDGDEWSASRPGRFVTMPRN